jgi:hypothetical protein
MVVSVEWGLQSDLVEKGAEAVGAKIGMMVAVSHNGAVLDADWSVARPFADFHKNQ